LSDLAHQVEIAIEGGIEPIFTGASTVYFAASARQSSAESKVAGRTPGIADIVESSCATAQDVFSVPAEMQNTSRALCREIPDIMRKAVKTNLHEDPRYEVNLAVWLEYDGVAT
jgi:hypothetical protein